MLEQKNKINITKKIPTIYKLSKKFSFIDDNILKNNITITFQYIIFLITIIDELDIDNTTISSSIYKDMILYTATIIESCLHFCLKKQIETEKIKSSDVMPTDWEIKNPKILYKISDEEQICGVVRHKKIEHLTNQTNFIVVNRACQKSGILSKDLFNKAEKIRKMRNKIHISSLRLTDDNYNKTKSQEAFDIAKSIIETVEKNLLNLN